VAHQHVEEPDKFSGGGFDGGGGVGTGKQLQAAAMPGHEALKQGTIHAVEIASGVGDGEQRFKVQMKRGVSEGGEIDEGGVAVSGLQCEGKVDGYGCGSAATLGVDDGEDFAAGAFFLNPALGGGEANKGLEEVGGGGGAVNELASAGPHGIDDDVRLVEASDGEHGGVGKFLAKEFNGAHGGGGIIGGNINQEDVRMGGLDAAHDGIGGSDGKTGTGMNRAGHTGAIDQHLEDGALFVVGGYDDDRKLGHS